ncbi:alpha/beta fold hydrolase [uncultured Flavobacterium sp.]|uniref:alpha/beta fold hydrolase n=1 Tax=uncultured Flavobacterium sp. TaxID=165435 RepID=UPI0030814259
MQLFYPYDPPLSHFSIFWDSFISFNGYITYRYVSCANDIKDLALYLKLEKAVVLGWSWAGLIAQFAALQYPDLILKAIILGSIPLGERTVDIAPAFLEAAIKPVNNFDDEIILFYEPKSPKSIEVAMVSPMKVFKKGWMFRKYHPRIKLAASQKF